MTLQEHMRSAAQTTSDAMSELLIGGADRIAALEAALDAAEEALGWHASACGEGSIPDVTVEALRKIEEVRRG